MRWTSVPVMKLSYPVQRTPAPLLAKAPALLTPTVALAPCGLAGLRYRFIVGEVRASNPNGNLSRRSSGFDDSIVTPPVT